MPWAYVLLAVEKLRFYRRKELHESELGISYLAFQKAEMNRDRKKQKKPFQMSDFFFYPDDSDRDSVNGIYGAAAVALIEKKMFPSWALFAYKNITENAEKSTAPEDLCYMSGDVVILAPTIVESTVKGLLIARKKVSRKIITLVNPNNGSMIKVQMPELSDGEVSLVEDSYVDIINILR